MGNRILRRISMIVAIGATPGAIAQTAPDQIRQGQLIAEKACARCHVVVPAGGTGWTDAPNFNAIANRDGASAGKLAGFIQQPHMHMLETARPAGEAFAVAAYIMSLRGR